MAGAVAGALTILACESAPQGAPTLDEIQAARTRGAVIRATTLDPVRCTWSRAGFEMCAWTFGDKDGAWYPLSKSIDTNYRVGLLCEFPTDGRPAERSCLVVPRVDMPPRDANGRRIRLDRQEAQRRLDAAVSAWAVTELVGDAPERCSRVDAEQMFCVWKADGRSAGFSLLAELLDDDARVQLSCTFPGDGRAREVPGGCRAQPF